MGSVSDVRHATTAVRPIVAVMPLAAASVGGTQLRHDAAFERARGEHAVRLAHVDRVDHLVVDVEPRDVGQEDEALRADAECERRRGVVGVHVQRPDRERRDDRDLAVARARRGASAGGTAAGRRPGRAAAPARRAARRGDRGSTRPAAPIAAQSAALTASIDSRTTSSAACDVRLPPLHELDRDAAPLISVGDLRAGAVHDDHLVALLGEAEDAARRVACDRAADLDDQPAHERYSALMRT